MVGRAFATWLAATVLAVAGAAHASCPLPAGPIAGLAATVRLLEPAMPRLLITARLELPAEHPDYADLLYLRERRVIARGAAVEPMAPEVWQAALDEVAGWYGAPPVRAGDPADPEAIARDLGELVDRVGRAVRPVALIAWTPEDRQRLAFLGMVWNWSSYPRLIVYRLDADDDRVDANLRGMARRLDTCAFAVRDYVAASAPVARDLFLAENRARMFIVGSEPDLPGAWPVEVPRGEEVDVFAFDHPLVASLDAYAAVFVGDPAPVLTFARLLPSVRTNLSPLGLTRVLATPR
jgi:hypothetical protein